MTDETQSTEGIASQAPAVGAAPVESNLEETLNIPETQVNEGATNDEALNDESKEPSLFDETTAQMEQESRPEWLPEKFKNSEDLSKSYKELEKKLGSHTGAPETYEMEIESGLEDYAISIEDPFATDFAKVLKENGVNQKTYNDLANLYAAKTKADEESIHDAQEHQFREDCKEIGEDRVKEIKESIKWASGIIDEESFELLKAIGDKDISVGLLVKQFHDAYNGKNYAKMPETASEMVDSTDLKEKARTMMHDPRYSSDSKWRKDTDTLYQKVMG